MDDETSLVKAGVHNCKRSKQDEEKRRKKLEEETAPGKLDRDTEREYRERNS
ncbi:MAG: hypothetical protein JRI25_11910 [Deltaproteobacteria bacterium]|nr:hypothetical protein [Deltaproteobacteria bacterium]MBW2255290.1 hypothetical protein [Deltaproteobacteria bacterium]